MDEVFYKERARHIRELATHADPFIKNRLLRLASNYDAMTTRPKATAYQTRTTHLQVVSQKVTEATRSEVRDPPRYASPPFGLQRT